MANEQTTSDTNEVIREFAERVNKLACKLMLEDTKVEGKHYAAMKIICKNMGIPLTF